jgi:hypothetical protein
MLRTLRHLAARLGYTDHQPRHRLGVPRPGQRAHHPHPSQLLRPVASSVLPPRPRHAIDDRVTGAITPDAWWHGGHA